jgi:nucleoside-diphosphate-sugar epimerase
MTPSRLLITGYPGWLASNLVLSALENNRYGFDSLRLMVQPGMILSPILRQHIEVAQLEVTFADLNDSAALENAAQDCSAVIHTAGIIHVDHPKEWFRVNTEGTGRLVEACRKAATVRRFVYLSSNAAGGRSTATQLKCESDPDAPLSAYGKSKWQAERLVLECGAPMEPVVLRPCMFYGLPVPDRHLDFFRRIETSWVPLLGDDVARSMVHVKNLTQACSLALRKAEAVNQVFYVADSSVYSVREYIDCIANLLNVQAKYVRLPGLISSVAFGLDRALIYCGIYHQSLHLVGEANWPVGVSIEKAIKLLDYKPVWTLKQGMAEAVNFYRSQRAPLLNTSLDATGVH